ncbi:MAG: glutamine--fructose-6-phosphate transaminase (isomerizing) [Candidatus Aquicultor sp.]|nr:glutamine--fructose-6-phosphate transaminase (isomerizing) [Candidatus Aquicultor sp.]
MCGIVGYIGQKDTVPILVNGLKRLEYRGYDSAGIATLNGDISIVRRLGKLAELEIALGCDAPTATIGIGHTRWATHGRPSEENAHPHADCSGDIAVVHNGIIENYLSLKEELQARGHVFKSETDTEVIAHLVEEKYDGNLFEAVRDAIAEVRGSFAIAVLSKHEQDKIIAARKDSPLILGLGEGENFIASDIPAILGCTRDILLLENDEMAEVTAEYVKIFDRHGALVEREIFEVHWDDEAAEKCGYEDFMLKEIYEQPVAIRETIRSSFQGSNVVIENSAHLTEDDVKSINKIFVVACGTSYHAGLVGKTVIENWARIPVEVDIASEFRYRNPIVDEKTLVVPISQSGETADTLASMREAKQRGAKIMAISNVVGSSIAREADGTIYTHAGPEIGVAATKTLVSQMSAIYVLALYLAQVRGTLTQAEIESYSAELKELPDKIETLLADVDDIKTCAQKFVDCRSFLFLGRGIGVPVAMEGALKLKEISYIHAEGYAAGEMKHGPIALLERSVPVVVVATKGHTYEKVISNIQEVRARDSYVIAVATAGDEEIKQHADYVFFVPETSEFLSAIPAVVPLQLLSYHIAKLRGCNVDQPRNLAKSVTVE